MKNELFGDAARSNTQRIEHKRWDTRDAAREAYEAYVDWLAQIHGWTDDERQTKLDEVANDAMEEVDE
jgi:hypothetical protein